MKNLVKRIEKDYGIKVEDFLKLYEDNLSRDDIAYELSIGVFKVRQIASLLGLRWKKKHRVNDLAVLAKQLKNNYVDVNISDLANDLEIANKELLKLNKSLVRARDLNTLYRKQIRHLSRTEYLSEKLIDTFKSSLDSFSFYKVDYEKDINNSSENTIVLALSDIHWGNYTSKELVGELNEFNVNIAKQRLKKCFDIVYNSDGNNIEIIVLGDILHGIIHNGNILGEVPVVKALVQFVEYFSSLVIKLRERFKQINVTLTNSNHSRLSEEVVYNNKTYDFDYLIYEFLKQMLIKYDITVSYNLSGYNLVKLPNNKYIFAYHGDTIRGASVLNETSILKISKLCSKMFGCTPNIILSGHIHKFQAGLTADGGYAYSVGSLIGTDEYAFNKGYIGECPSQLLLSITKSGEVDYHKIIKLCEDN